MKQITLDDATRAKLKKAAGDGVNLDNLAVFKAAALTTAPVRKKHPVYEGAVHARSFLEQMNAELEKESRPVQLNHMMGDGDHLPIGRVFAGNISVGTGPDNSDELEVLFWIDKSAHQSKVDLVNNGTIDQVSVAVLGKEALSNKTGFDFLGPKADFFENILAGTDDKGNIMGKDGAHVVIQNLDQWFEMSLVGRGGATGARIKGSGSGQTMHLAASDQDVPPLTLQLSTGGTGPTPPTPPTPQPNKDELDMDAKEFAGIIAENAGKVATLTAERDAERAKASALTTERDALKAELDALKATDAAKQVETLTAEKTDLTNKLSAAEALTANVVAPLFAAAGKVGEKLDADPTKAVDQVKGVVQSLRGLFSGGSGGARPADHGSAGGGDFVNGGGRTSAYKRAG